MLDGKTYTDRAAYERHVKANNCEIAGDDIKPLLKTPEPPKPDKAKLREDIARARSRLPT